MRESYRKGAIGALMDEYERAAADLNRRQIEKFIRQGLISVRPGA